MEPAYKDAPEMQEEKTGEDLLAEYYGQDKGEKHDMGYSIHGQTYSDCGC